jgi:hypothetical protein
MEVVAHPSVVNHPQLESWLNDARSTLLYDSTEVRVRYYSRLFSVIALAHEAPDPSKLFSAIDDVLSFAADNGLTGGYYEAEARSWFIRVARQNGYMPNEVAKFKDRLNRIFDDGTCSREGLLGRILDS